jgi:hypothetical protein
MANITVTASTTNVNVDSTLNTVDVSSTISNVLVGETTFVANNIVRAAISVTDTGGDGSLSYNEPTGVITYTGPSPSEVRAHFSATTPLNFNSGTGDFTIDTAAIFTGKTTDDLAQGTTNKYFTTSGATVNTDALPQGTTNKYFTTSGATINTDALPEGTTNKYFSTTGATVNTDALPQGNVSQNRYLRTEAYGPSQLLMTNFLNVTDGRSTTGITANTDGSIYQVQQPGMVLKGDVGFNFSTESSADHVESWDSNLTFAGRQNVYIGDGYSLAKRLQYFTDGAGNIQKSGQPPGLFGSSLVDGLNINNQREPTYGDMAGLGLGFLNRDSIGVQGGSVDAGFLSFPASSEFETTTPGAYQGSLSITNSNAGSLRTDNPHIYMTTRGRNKSSADAANLRVSIGTTSTDAINMLNVNGTSKFTGNMSVTGNINVTGNVEVDGNLNYRNVEDLYVRDQSITLNANATVNSEVEIIANRPQSTYDAVLKWNGGRWQYSNGDNSYHNIIDGIEAKTLFSTTTAAASGGGALSYNTLYGTFTFAPADLSDKIELTDLSVTTLTPSGDGALSYDNTSGVFTFTPADADEAPVYSVNRKLGVVQLGTNLIPEGNVVGFDITTSNSVNQKLINSQFALPRGMTFSANGLKMFVVGQEASPGTDDFVSEYVLTKAFDTSTITYSQRFSIETQTTVGEDVKFNTDGTKMFVTSNDGSTLDGVFEYDLSSGFDVSTASYNSVSFSTATQENGPASTAFNSDGTKMFVVGVINDTVFEYDLSTGFDLSTASYSSNSFDVSSQADVPKGMQFNTDGTEMFIADGDHLAATNKVYKYTLTTGFDLTTASYSGTSFDFTPQTGVGQVQDLAFNSNGTKMYLLDYNSLNPVIQEYELDLDGDGSGNLYYTQGRFDTAFTAKSTSDLSEGTNLYYTDTRSRSAVSVTTAAASGNGALAYNSTTGAFTFTPADTSLATKSTDDLSQGTTNLYYSQSRTRSDVDGETASPSGTGSLVYDNTTGMFTYTPPDISNKIELTSLSTATAAASGGGSLAYDNTSGVFTFAPADVHNATEILNGTSSVEIPVTNGNISVQAGGTVTAVVSTGLVNVTGNILASKNLSAVQASASDVGGLQAINGQSTIGSYNNQTPFVNTETGILAVQAGDLAANVYSVPRYSSVKLPDIPASLDSGQFTSTNIEAIGNAGGVWDSNVSAMPPGSLASVYDPKIYKRRAFAIPNYNPGGTPVGWGYAYEGATTHATGTILFDTDSSNVTVQSAQSFGTLFPGSAPSYTIAPVSQGIIKFRTLQPAILGTLPTPYAYTEANDFANSTVAYIDDKLRVGREDDNTSFSFPKTAGTVNQTLVLDGSRDLLFENKGQLTNYTTTEINALATPAAGYMVFNTTENLICVYNGTGWRKINDAAM